MICSCPLYLLRCTLLDCTSYEATDKHLSIRSCCASCQATPGLWGSFLLFCLYLVCFVDFSCHLFCLPFMFFLSFSLACAHRQWSGTRTARDAPRLSTAAKAATRTFTPIRPENVRQDSYPEKFGRVYSIRVRIGKVDAVLSPLSRFCRHRFDGYGDRALVTRFTFN